MCIYFQYSDEGDAASYDFTCALHKVKKLVVTVVNTIAIQWLGAGLLSFRTRHDYSVQNVSITLSGNTVPDHVIFLPVPFLSLYW